MSSGDGAVLVVTKRLVQTVGDADVAVAGRQARLRSSLITSVSEILDCYHYNY